MKRRVFIDSGVLIAAVRGQDAVAHKAFEILGDPDLEFSSSIFVQLETQPKAIFYKKTDEEEFYKTYFNEVSCWAEPNQSLAQSALAEANLNGLGALDALHVAAAIICESDELVTIEKSDKSIHRVKHLQIRSIAP
jgi:predicted nucleic acid-binding protein